MTSVLTKTGVVLLAVYVLIVLAAWLGQRRLMYVPSTNRVAPATAGLAETKEIAIELVFVREAASAERVETRDEALLLLDRRVIGGEALVGESVVIGSYALARRIDRILFKRPRPVVLDHCVKAVRRQCAGVQRGSQCRRKNELFHEVSCFHP